MPGFFSDYDKGTSQLKDILNGDPKAQIEALRNHVFITVGGGKSAAPATTTKKTASR